MMRWTIILLASFIAYNHLIRPFYPSAAYGLRQAMNAGWESGLAWMEKGSTVPSEEGWSGVMADGWWIMSILARSIRVMVSALLDAEYDCLARPGIHLDDGTLRRCGILLDRYLKAGWRAEKWQ
jgi:hypothetical protein